MTRIRTVLVALSLVFTFGMLASPALAREWHRADTHHFTIYSDGSAQQLEEFARELEMFDALLRSLWNIPVAEQPQKLTIFTVARSEEVEALYGKPNVAGFYRPRVEGSFAVSNRERESSRNALSGRETLFHEYAHHFMFNNFSIPAPSWFVEGYAEFVATADFRKNGQWTFGKPAYHRKAEIEYGAPLNLEDLLTFGTEDGPKKYQGGFYGWSWALTHMLYIDNGDGGRAIVSYLNAINRGKPSLVAAQESFGDLGELQKRLRGYVGGSITFKKSPRPVDFIEKVELQQLTAAEGEAAEMRMKVASGSKLEKTRAELAEMTGRGDASADIWYLLAMAEKELAHSREDEEDGSESDEDTALPAAESETTDLSAKQVAHLAQAEAALDKALSLDPDHVRANVAKGHMLVDRLARDGDTDHEKWAEARAFLIRANRADPLDPEALYQFAMSYNREGSWNPQAQLALKEAFNRAPEATEVRIAYAYDLASRGDFSNAIRILEVLANHPHYRAAGRSALDHVRRMQQMRNEESSSRAPAAATEES